MKGIFYLLLLLNLGYFGWQYTSHGEDALSQGIDSAMSGDRGDLMLLSELSDAEKMKLYKNPAKFMKQQQEQTAHDMDEATTGSEAQSTQAQGAGSESDKPESASPQICYTAGPFVSDSARKAFINKLGAFGYSVSKQWSDKSEAVRYWVYLPPMRSKAEAREVVASLQRKGIKDVAVVSSGEFKNAISLGLFSSKENARERVALLQKYAYSPKISQSSVSKNLFWLSFQGAKELSASRQSRLLREFPSAKMKQSDCK